MVITRRACLLALCAMLSLPLLHDARAADPTPKAAISGLVSRGEPSNTLKPLDAEATAGVFFGGLVVQATWSELQPKSSNDFVTTTIEQALTQVRIYNGNNSTRPLAVRLRVFKRVLGAGLGQNPRRRGPVQHRFLEQFHAFVFLRPILERRLSDGVEEPRAPARRQV
jgi:hypothetical protein